MTERTKEECLTRRSRDIHVRLLLTLLVWFSSLIDNIHVDAAGSDKLENGIPPLIIRQSVGEVAYVLGERTTLHCEASGDPTPQYSWWRNGSLLVMDPAAGASSDAGSLIIHTSLSVDVDGTYQCRAQNPFGTALSLIVSLRQAVLGAFPSVTTPRVHQPIVGSALSLLCTPPKSYPAANVYWGESSDEAKLKPIESTARISSDYEGNLHFANVQREDSLNGRSYVCYVLNSVIKRIVQGDDQQIDPVPLTTPSITQPTLIWSSAPTRLALRGQTLRMKCIFAGYPTPTVRWERVDSHLTFRMTSESFGQELVIRDVESLDSGVYRCSGVNMEHREPVSRDFTVIVESAPYWINRPESKDVVPGSDVRFDCNVGGHPEPIIEWTSNGRSLDDDNNSRMVKTSNHVTYMNVTTRDRTVLQCNATNKHGTIYANAYLSVRENIPTENPVRINQQTTEDAETLHATTYLRSASISWLIILVCCVCLFVLVLIILFVLVASYRNRTIVYLVGEKEKKQGVIIEGNDVDEETLNIALRDDIPNDPRRSKASSTLLVKSRDEDDIHPVRVSNDQTTTTTTMSPETEALESVTDSSCDDPRSLSAILRDF